MFAYIFQDWIANAGNAKGRFVLTCFRLGQLLRRTPCLVRWIFAPYFALYKLIVVCIVGVELPLRLQAGAGLQVYHGQALVVHSNTVIGKNCALKQCTTIGITARNSQAAPVIGDNVNIGCNSVVLGNIHIGNNVIIGAGSVVTKSVPDNTIVAGNPAREINSKRPCVAPDETRILA